MEKETKNQKSWVVVLVIIGVLVLLGGSAGMAAFGFGRVVTSKNFNDNIEIGSNRMGGNFGRGMMGGLGYQNSNLGNVRISGDVTKIDGNTLTVKVTSQTYTVTVTDVTSFIKNRDVAKQSDLQVNNSIIVSGTSNAQGVVSATAVVIN